MENVEIVRRFVAHVNAQDLSAAMAYVAPGAELDWSDSEAPDSGRFHGHEEWGAFFSGRWDGLTDASFDESEILEVTPESVLIVASWRGRGRTSGLEIQARGAAVITLGAGRIDAIRVYQSREDALSAVGLGG